MDTRLVSKAPRGVLNLTGGVPPQCLEIIKQTYAEFPMRCKVESGSDGHINVHHPPRILKELDLDDEDNTKAYLRDIDASVESLQSSLWPLNQYIHDNPELAFAEYKAHDALTKYIRSFDDWEVATSAYGMETAWIATYYSGREGPVVSFNAEMGTCSLHTYSRRITHHLQMHYPTWAMRVDTI